MELQIRRCSVRILFPFRWTGDETTLDDLSKSIVGESSPWQAHDPRSPSGKLAHSEYFREYLPHVNDFLFNAAGQSGCRYFQVAADGTPQPLRDGCSMWSKRLDPDEAAAGPVSGPGKPTPRGLQLLGVEAGGSAWIEKPPDVQFPPEPASAPPSGPLPFQVRIGPNTRVEMWLGKSGAGVLSLSLICHPSGEAGPNSVAFQDGLVRLNHALATAQHGVWFPCVGAAGETDWQHLHHWLRDLIQPLRSRTALEFDLRGVVCTALEVVEPAQRHAWFERALDEQLSHLAQDHPRSHPGEGRGLQAHLLTINRRHRCALSLGGAAHAALLPASNAESVDYDKNRLRRIQMEYFPGFLLAQLQRLCLQQFINESAAASRLEDRGAQRAAHERLLTKVMRFGLEGEFVQACWRGTLQKHHELAQQVCLIHEGLQTVRAAMGDFAAVSNQQFERAQREASERAEREHQEEAQQSERTMQVLEVFIVTFYSVELAHILGESFEFGHTPVGHWPFGDTPFMAWSLMGVAIATFFMAALLVSWKWLKKKGTTWTIVALFLMATVIHAVFLLANGVFRHFEHESGTQPGIEIPVNEEHGH